MGRTVRAVRGRGKCSFAFTTDSLGARGVVAMATEGLPVRGMIRRVLVKRGIDCAIRNGSVVVGGGDGRTARRGGGDAVDKVVASGCKRPVVNTGVGRGGNAGKAVSSVSKGFRLAISRNDDMRVSCLKCLARRIGAEGGARLTVSVGRSTRTLSRIIIMKCKAVGGESLANTVSSVGVSRAPIRAFAAIDRTLTKGTTNLRMIRADTRMNNNDDFGVHKTTSINTKGSPLVVVSNFPISSDSALNSNGHCRTKRASGVLRSVGPGSVRSVRILGSTDSATVCNTETKRNIVVIAAGQKGRKGTDIGCSTGISIREVGGSFGVLGKRSCVCRAGQCCRRL